MTLEIQVLACDRNIRLHVNGETPNHENLTSVRPRKLG